MLSADDKMFSLSSSLFPIFDFSMDTEWITSVLQWFHPPFSLLNMNFILAEVINKLLNKYQDSIYQKKVRNK